LSKQLYDGILELEKVQQDIGLFRQRSASTPGERSETRRALLEKLDALVGQPAPGFGGGRGAAPSGPETLTRITGTLTQLMNLLQGADVTPTSQLVAAVAERRAALNKLLAQWTAVKAEAASLR
jgi:hypothetical protein